MIIRGEGGESINTTNRYSEELDSLTEAIDGFLALQDALEKGRYSDYYFCCGLYPKLHYFFRCYILISCYKPALSCWNQLITSYEQ